VTYLGSEAFDEDVIISRLTHQPSISV
jgi:hypothetical protein